MIDGSRAEEIAACRCYAFFKNIAYFMYHGCYAGEFRIKRLQSRSQTPYTEAARNKDIAIQPAGQPTV